MSELTELVVLARYANSAQRDRLAFYLDPATRPDFPDEVPATEAAWVEAFEFLPAPALETPDAHTLLARFGAEAGLGAELDAILRAIALTEPAAVYFYAFLGDNEWYGRCRDGHKALIWAVSGLDDPQADARLNRALDETLKQRLRALDDPAQALLVLAEQKA